MNREYISQFRDKIEIVENKRQDALFNFYKTITTISIGLLGLLIGLMPEKYPTKEALIFYGIGLSLLVLTIISSLICQYYEVVQLNNETKLYLKKINDIIKGDLVSAEKLERVKTSWHYHFFQWATGILLIAAFCLMILYVFNSGIIK